MDLLETHMTAPSQKQDGMGSLLYPDSTVRFRVWAPFASSADVVLFEVEGEADDSVLELEHFQRDRVLEAVGAGYAVPHLQDGSDLGEIGLDVVVLDSVLENRGDLFGTKLHRIPFMVRRMV